MTQVFVYDGERWEKNSEKRDWNKIVGQHDELRWTAKPPPAVSGFLTPPPQGSVIVCHKIGDKTRRAGIEELARNGAFVVFVSGGGNVREKSEASPNLYRRRKPVGKPTDDHFRACFTLFLRALRAPGMPNWALLEGSPPPDNLIAYHLLGFLGEEGNEERKRIEDAATEEAIAIILAKGEKTKFEEAKQEALKALADNSSVAKFLKEKCAE